MVNAGYGESGDGSHGSDDDEFLKLMYSYSQLHKCNLVNKLET